MDETLTEKAARRVRLLEESRQKYLDTRAFWEQRKTDNYPDSNFMLALLDRDLEINAMLLEHAKERLAQLSADPD